MSQENNNRYWENKLLAFLHDPPDKALDIGGHEERARRFMQAAGIATEEIDKAYRRADWIASAADRFPFPDWRKSKLNSSFGDQAHPFRHPLGGSDLPIDPAFPSKAIVEDVFQTTQKGIDVSAFPAERRAWANYFLHWRRWPVESALKDLRTAFLPADTRIPDHSVWCHGSLVSALEGCYLQGTKPAFLLFQVGPVQEFIAQARSTRDLWSGSYLLSWLTAHAIKAVTDRFGPDHIVFPSLRGIPLFDFLHKEDLYDVATYAAGNGKQDTLWKRLEMDPQTILTPAMPNRFLALVPAGVKGEAAAQAAEEAVHAELMRIAAACWEWLANEAKHPLGDASSRNRFNRQVADFSQIAWQTTPWSEASPADQIADFLKLCDPPLESAKNLSALHEVATREIPQRNHADERCVKNGELTSPGFTWACEYARASRNLDARRQLRDFSQWPPDVSGTPKDSLSGKEEIAGGKDWWKNAMGIPSLARIFKSQDRLGAVNLCKKIWHEAYLKNVRGLDVKRALAFESVPGVAAGAWRQAQMERLKTDRNGCDLWIKLCDAINSHADEVNADIRRPNKDLGDPREWIECNDPEIFMSETWRKHQDGKPTRDITEVLEILSSKDIPAPPRTFAVLALDGDCMGQWISGVLTPPLFGQLSQEARDYFTRENLAAKLRGARPVSPAYHLQFSEALANFSLYMASPVVKYFGGQLIYAGGDDVLAMLPARKALECARALRAAFRGEKILADLVPGMFAVHGTNGGFVQLLRPCAGQPKWPLIVPGPRSDVSAGLAMAHVQSPLQNVVRAAQAAEKHAKNAYDREAFAVTLYKRSGETVEWGAKWESGALEAYGAFLDCRRESDEGRKAVFSSRFPYALNALLAPYELDCSMPGRREDAPSFPFKDAIMHELRHVLSRQCEKANRDTEQVKCFLKKAELYLDRLCADGGRPLPDFANLFRVAAFLERGE